MFLLNLHVLLLSCIPDELQVHGPALQQSKHNHTCSQAAVPAPASRVWRQSWEGRICPLVSARSAGETPVGEWPPLSLNTHCPSRSTKRAGAWVTVLLVSCKPILLCTSNLTPHHFVPSPSTNSKTSQVVARAPWWPSG